MRDDEDDLPFASRPKKVVMKKAAKPMSITAGVTTSYNEILDDDTDIEAVDPLPQTKLAGEITPPAPLGGFSKQRPQPHCACIKGVGECVFFCSFQ